MARITSIEEGLEYATRIAALSNHPTRVGAVITDRHNHILSFATNSFKTHTRQRSYALRVGEDKKICLHAEIAGIIKAGRGAKTIYVARLGAGGRPLRAVPCPICQLAIKEAGIKRIFNT